MSARRSAFRQDTAARAQRLGARVGRRAGRVADRRGLAEQDLVAAVAGGAQAGDRRRARASGRSPRGTLARCRAGRTAASASAAGWARSRSTSSFTRGVALCPTRAHEACAERAVARVRLAGVRVDPMPCRTATPTRGSGPVAVSSTCRPRAWAPRTRRRAVPRRRRIGGGVLAVEALRPLRWRPATAR